MFYIKKTTSVQINYNGNIFSYLNDRILKNNSDFIIIGKEYLVILKAFFTENYIYLYVATPTGTFSILFYENNGTFIKSFDLENDEVSFCACDFQNVYLNVNNKNYVYVIEGTNINKLTIGYNNFIIKDSNYLYAVNIEESMTNFNIYLLNRTTYESTFFKEYSPIEVVNYLSFPLNNANVSPHCLSLFNNLSSYTKFIQINNDATISENPDVNSEVDFDMLFLIFGRGRQGLNMIEFYTDKPNLYSATAIRDDYPTDSIQLYEESNDYNITLKFDNDVVRTYTKTTDTILKVVKISLLGGSITVRLKYSKGDDDFTSTLEYPNSYKYATSVTIGENTYNITDNAVEVNDLNISSDVEIKLNNGVIAYYDITFKNDTQLLQLKRTEENTLPVYEGDTPVQEGKVFIGWNPEIYTVDKAQIYQATFEEIIKTYEIDIVDSNNLPINLLWSNTSQDNTFDKKIIAISIKKIDFEPYLLYSVNVKYEDENKFTLICQVGYNNVKATPNNYTINNVNYEFENEYELEINSDTTITINSVEETPTLRGNFISKAGTTTPFAKIKFIDKNGSETEITDFNFATK